MQIFCGLPHLGAHLVRNAERLGTPILVSANASWRRGAFRGYEAACELEVPVALDSAGFVAMKCYGGYRWSIAQYLELAVSMRPLWYAAPDLACEPAIAANAGEVDRWIARTVVMLAQTLAHVVRWNEALPGLPATAPIPVLQGWKPDDYRRCAERIERFVLDDPLAARALGQPAAHRAEWPPLVGIGSVCKRHLLGPDGLFRVLDAVEAALPHRVRFHLFGVQSNAVERLKERDRVASIDSMAWNKHARWEAYREGAPNNKARLIRAMDHWVDRQRQRAQPGPQLTLSLN